ncbi:Abortive infection protein [Methanolacinia petrolearia DSM 11571]|uniref:Abortive infection protein n=1 Tax=Methanolacinia petrolearia (strain DSM 11571 / OCM 486 / SEBR 4847) TaxID=679926 RepID=E1RJA1_METP4|nr:type II CAAX endopeptidase family protein [Methanolacinia petrolearia]ADN35619.1 Abortive infection protein [Methanolacinia petrolearia DSM 11571]
MEQISWIFLPDPEDTPGAAARKKVIFFLVLAFALSAVGWVFVTKYTASGDRSGLVLATVFTMWCPGFAGLLTRFYFQRNLKGFGFCIGDYKWQIISFGLPVAVGLLIFGAAWVSGIAGFNSYMASTVFSLAYIPAFVYALGFNIFAAAGEEIGWRGLLVPEMAKFMGFTELALISGVIWTVWHLPLILFSTYNGAGPLWYSVLVFIPSVMGAGLILAWLRLKSGSVLTAILFHGFWNYFIQQFYPSLTVPTPASDMMLGEFGWACPIAYVLLAIVFWHYRSGLPAGIK